MSTTKFVLNETSYFGNGAREVLAEEITKKGFKKIFLVSDKSLVEAGVTAKVEEEIKKSNIEYTLYSEIKPNPTRKITTIIILDINLFPFNYENYLY